MTVLEKKMVEEEVVKLELKGKRVKVKIYKELLGALAGLRGIFTPSRSRIENTMKLWTLGMILIAIIIISVL